MISTMDAFYKFDYNTAGSKGLVLIGDNALVYRRDEKTDLYPLYLDFPGGGPEGNETPFDTFRREVKEEFDLDITPENVVHVRTYPSTLFEGKIIYFPVVHLPESAANTIHFGDEGLEYLMLPVEEFVQRDDAWPTLKERTLDYIHWRDSL